MTQLLLSYSPDIEARDTMGWTPLIVACKLPLALWPNQAYELGVAAAGQYDIVNELLASGAQVDAANEKGQTSL